MSRGGDRLYDSPPMKKAREQQEAKKGDVKNGKDIDLEDAADPDAEYESVGSGGRKEGDPERISDDDVHEGTQDVLSKASPRDKGTRVDKKNEWWRKRAKPMS